MLKSSKFWGKCKRCGTDFEIFSSGGLDYGTRLLRSKKSLQPAKIIYSFDPVFEEVSRIVKNILRPRGFSEAKISEKFDEVFGKICDSAPDGSLYDMSGKITCPVCHSDEVSYGPTNPPIYKEMDVPDVTHSKWDKLTPEQKYKTIEMLLEEACKKDEKKHC